MAKRPINPFLATIIENPDDDAPRLVYADWLEEHGETGRADFIRVQIDQFHCPKTEPAYESLERRAYELLQKHWQELIAEFPKTISPHLHFERGFVEWIGCSVPVFLSGAAGVFQRSPVQKVWLYNSSRSLERLLRNPYLERIRELTIRSQLDDVDTVQIANCLYLRNVRRLVLDRNRIGNDGARALATSDALLNLDYLSLNDNPIDGEGRAALQERFADRVHF